MLFDLPTFTLIHVVLSVIGVVAGLITVGGLMAGRLFKSWAGLFLATTVCTSATGFGFPFSTLLPSHIVGALSLVVLPFAIAALYWKHLAGKWNTAFVVVSVLALYLNVSVLVVQLFQKIPILSVIAPTPQSPLSATTQLLILLLFVLIGRAAVKGCNKANMT